ncbi:hypothetical protein MTO96_033837 [Rhipicephalus appendiculatus]
MRPCSPLRVSYSAYVVNTRPLLPEAETSLQLQKVGDAALEVVSARRHEAACSSPTAVPAATLSLPASRGSRRFNAGTPMACLQQTVPTPSVPTASAAAGAVQVNARRITTSMRPANASEDERDSMDCQDADTPVHSGQRDP